MTQNVWEQEAVKDLVQLEEGEFNLCDFALFLSVMKNETAHRNVLSIIMGEKDLELKEVKDLHLEDGTTKIFLNMSSKNGEPVLVSLLQYMKHTTLENPEILVKDERIMQLNEIVTEVKQSEEWEAVRMSILSIGLERGEKIGLEKGMARGLSCGKVQGKAQSILELLEENGPVSEKTRNMILSETDTERLSVWLKAAARSGSEEDFLSKI